MPDVLVRQWSDHCHAAYLDLGQRYPVFVGTADSEVEAVEWGRVVLADEDGTLENRCGALLSGACVAGSKRSGMGESRLLNSDGPRSVTTPAHLPLTQPGASS